jgi:hypothetical protein
MRKPKGTALATFSHSPILILSSCDHTCKN